MQTFTATAPAYWASYLINGDASGLEDGEQAAADAWIETLGLGGPVDCSAESEFIHCPDADVLECDCLTYTFLIPAASQYAA